MLPPPLAQLGAECPGRAAWGDSGGEMWRETQPSTQLRAASLWYREPVRAGDAGV